MFGVYSTGSKKDEFAINGTGGGCLRFFWESLFFYFA